jgi:2-aminobenzoate-CoA ligase
MTSLQNLPADYLPPADLLPVRVYTLPELRDPRRLNVPVEFLDRAIAAGWAGRPAFYFEGRTLTYGEIARDVNRFGNALRALGIAPGDRVLLRLGDQPELVVAILALLKIGAIAIPTFPMLRASHLLYREQDTEARAIIAGVDLLEEVEKARPEFKHVRHLIVVPGARESQYLAYSTLLAGAAEDLSPAPTAGNDFAFLLYTSGSTGDPKGVLWSHADIVAAADSYSRRCVRPGPDDVFVGPPPIPFAAGLLFFLISPLRFGASSVLIREKNPDRMVDAVTRYRGTVFAAMATYDNMLLKAVGSRVRERFGGVRQTLVGGEPVPRELSERWQAESGHPLVQFLGTTEMANCFLSSRWGIDPLRPTSAERPVPGYQVVVRDPDSFEEVVTGRSRQRLGEACPGTRRALGPGSLCPWTPA